MMTRAQTWLLACGLAVAGGSVWKLRAEAHHKAAGEQARALVERAWTAGQQVPLEGLQTIKMSPRAVPGPIRTVQAEVLTSRDGRMRIRYITAPLAGVTIWEDDSHTYRYNPRRKRLTVAERRAKLDERARERIQVLASYDARVVTQEQVAGRNTTVVELRPRRGAGHWRRLWIDPLTGVILRDDESTADNALERSTQFTKVAYLTPDHEPDAAEFHPSPELVRKFGTARPGDTSSRFEPEALAKLLGFTIRQPKWLPKGYALRGAYQTPCTCDVHHQAARLEYSDGLSTLTLFECGHEGHAEKANCFAGTDNSKLSVRNETGGYSYLIVGDLPQADLERVVKSVTQ